MAKQQEATTKSLAKKAMQRLKSGYWEQRKQTRYAEESLLVKYGISPINGDLIPDADELYATVVRMLESGDFIANPIEYMCDKRLLASLDEGMRARYIAKLQECYRLMSQKYYQEKNCGN